MRHPEMRDDEVFLGNFGQQAFARMTWDTKRRGEVAYDREGQALDPNRPIRFLVGGGSIGRLYPVFVKKSEYEKRQASMKGN